MIGEILDFKYRLERELGAGGMGNVYLATHLGTTRVVAVKVIAPRWADDPQFLHRFQREAQACGRLRHPNIVNVTDFGIAQAAGAYVPYLVMEYLDGETLSSYRKSHPDLPLAKITDILDQVGLALTEAHRHEIVHRDLKPDNIWLEPDGRGGHTVKVLDFGVAKMNVPSGQYAATPAYTGAPAQMDWGSGYGPSLDPYQQPPAPIDTGAEAKTMPGSLLGTPAFMSPEQALGREIDYRSDIYSLAVVAYLLVCGRLPFEGQAHELFAYHFSGVTLPPYRVRPMPRDVSDAILAGLARDPAERPVTATVFTRRLHNAAAAESSALRLSKAFVMEHAGTFAALLVPGWFGLLIVVAAFGEIGKHIPGPSYIGNAVLGLLTIPAVIVSDNLMRATAALLALEHR
ncbi:MAG: serine/threonine-protein kinase, partial [Bryobacteraceae bacterium]